MSEKMLMLLHPVFAGLWLGNSYVEALRIS